MKRNCQPVIHSDAESRADETPGYGSGPTSVLEDYGARLDRLEKLVLSERPLPNEPSSRAQHVASSPRGDRGVPLKSGLRTRFFGRNGTRVLLNLVSSPVSAMVQSHLLPSPIVRRSQGSHV